MLTGLLLLSACSPSSGNVEPATATADAPRPATTPGRTLVVGQGEPGAVVSLEPMFAHDFPASSAPAYIDQSGQMFIPGLVTARIGQDVQFRSSEDVLHNVRVDCDATGEPIFNVATPPWGKYVHRFDQPGFYNVSCDIHTTMRATLFLADAPYVTQVGESGAFTFPDVVPGRYRVTGFIAGNPIQEILDVAGPETRLTVP